MDSPKTLFDREDRFNSRYYFISYAHRNRDAVFNVLNSLFDGGVNFWYDKELSIGDKWNEKVRDVILDNRCVGAIIFLSKESLISEAVEHEIQLFKQREAQGLSEFKILPVIIGYQSAQDLLFETAKENSFVYNRLPFYHSLTLNDIWVTYEDNELIEKLVSEAEQANIMAKNTVQVRKSFLASIIEFIQGGGDRNYLFGKYPYGLDGRSAQIEWSLLNYEDSKLYFVSKYCLDFLNEDQISEFTDNLQRQLTKQLAKLIEASTNSSDTNVEIVSLAPLNVEFIKRFGDRLSKTLPTDFADKNRQQVLRAFWVVDKEQNGRTDYVLYNSLNKRLKEEINHKNINAGLRLLLIIKDDNIGRNTNGAVKNK